MGKDPIKKKRIHQLRRRDGDLCWICGERIFFPRFPGDTRTPYHLRPSIDHVDPEGNFNVANLRLAHRACNGMRGRVPPDALPSYLVGRAIGIFLRRDRKDTARQRAMAWLADRGLLGRSRDEVRAWKRDNMGARP